MRPSLRLLNELCLNTPEKYWLVIRGYHIHKSFWGTGLVISGLVFSFVPTIIFGTLLVTLSVAGHIKTHNQPYFKLWDKVK